MSVTMTMPPGCIGVELADGTKYDTTRAGRIEVADRHAADVQRSWAGHTGTIDARQPRVLGTKNTRWCLCCQPSRAWQAWTMTCHRCGTATVAISEPFPTEEEENR